MNELINGNAIKMTSIEIAELVGKRHDNVKRAIETLAKNGVIRLPQIEVSERINNLGFNVQYEHYVFEGEQGKRDSIIVVAQLSPEFTARLVDRWRELEEAAVNIPKTLPEALRLAADLPLHHCRRTHCHLLFRLLQPVRHHQESALTRRFRFQLLVCFLPSGPFVNRGYSVHTSISLTVPPASLNFAIRLSALCSN